jgi:hypothetical protein
MGNHTIAERMFRLEPSVMLHAPLALRGVINDDQIPIPKIVVPRSANINNANAAE